MPYGPSWPLATVFEGAQCDALRVDLTCCQRRQHAAGDCPLANGRNGILLFAPRIDQTYHGRIRDSDGRQDRVKRASR